MLITTFSNRFFVIRLEHVRAMAANPTPEGGNACTGEGRLIEKGAQLIGHEPGSRGARVWLQMPRGNLEQFSPRELLLERLNVLIEQREYRDALIEMRRHRIDMNLINGLFKVHTDVLNHVSCCRLRDIPRTYWRVC